MESTLQKGDFLTVEYVGREKATGKIFDLTSEELAKKENLYDEEMRYGSITIVLGAGHVLQGLETELEKMKVGEKKKVIITPEHAFGERKSEFIKLVPMAVFKKERMNPVPGMPVKINNIPGIVQTVSGGRVKVDFNHPLAGKELEYEINVLGKITDVKEQILSLFRFHIPKTELKELQIDLKSDVVELTTPKEQKTRRYIKVTEEVIATDILKYIKNIKKVKFIDVFEGTS